MSGRWVWLSGRFLLEEEASVPASSRSVRLGVGVYDTFRVTRSRAPLLARHISRLESAARGLDLWPGPVDWSNALAELARRNQLADGIARITLGDGFAMLGLAPLPPELESERRLGIALSTQRLERPLAHLKSTSRLDLELAEQRAGGEALLVAASGSILETTRANFFALTGNGLQTAPLPDVLPGVARELLFEIADERGLEVREVAPRLAECRGWREAFASSAPRGIRPVISIDGVALGAGSPGPITLELQRLLDLRSGLEA